MAEKCSLTEFHRKSESGFYPLQTETPQCYLQVRLYAAFREKPIISIPVLLCPDMKLFLRLCTKRGSPSLDFLPWQQENGVLSFSGCAKVTGGRYMVIRSTHRSGFTLDQLF